MGSAKKVLILVVACSPGSGFPETDVWRAGLFDQGRADAFNPAELLLAAIAACMIVLRIFPLFVRLLARLSEPQAGSGA